MLLKQPTPPETYRCFEETSLFEVDVILHLRTQHISFISLYAREFLGKHFPVLSLLRLQGAQGPRLPRQPMKEALIPPGFTMCLIHDPTLCLTAWCSDQPINGREVNWQHISHARLFVRLGFSRQPRLSSPKDTNDIWPLIPLFHKLPILEWRPSWCVCLTVPIPGYLFK